MAADVLTGADHVIHKTLGRLLELQEQIERLGEASSLGATLRGMTLGEAIDTVRRMAEPPAGRPAPREPNSAHRVFSTLSDRELEVVQLVAEGLSNKEIGSRLKLSDKTIKNHISHILAKMSLTARTQVAVHAIRSGLV